jgi:hypothetical protein
MPETGQIVFSHREIVETLIKKQGLHSGIWALFVRFGLAASNIGPTESEVNPAAIVPIVEMGLQKAEKESNIAVDAAKVNPKSQESKPGKTKKKG